MSNVFHVEFPGRRADIIRTAEEFAVGECAHVARFPDQGVAELPDDMDRQVFDAAMRVIHVLQTGRQPVRVSRAAMNMLNLVEELIYTAERALGTPWAMKDDDGGSAA